MAGPVDDILEAAEQAPIAVASERREVTVLFCDIRGFSKHAAAMSADEVVELLDDFHALMLEATMKHDGSLERFLGDGVMAVFGAPPHHPDHALRATRAALAMHAAVRELSVRRVAAGGTPLAVGIGLDTGEVLTAGGRMGSTVIGDSVGLASRLEANATAGQTLMTAQTYRRLGDAVRGRALGRFDVSTTGPWPEVWDVIGTEPR